MQKLIIMIEDLPDQEQFDQMWPEFLHLSESMPGLIKEATCRIDSTLFGKYHPTLLHELFFDSISSGASIAGCETLDESVGFKTAPSSACRSPA